MQESDCEGHSLFMAVGPAGSPTLPPSVTPGTNTGPIGAEPAGATEEATEAEARLALAVDNFENHPLYGTAGRNPDDLNRAREAQRHANAVAAADLDRAAQLGREVQRAMTSTPRYA